MEAVILLQTRARTRAWVTFIFGHSDCWRGVGASSSVLDWLDHRFSPPRTTSLDKTWPWYSDPKVAFPERVPQKKASGIVRILRMKSSSSSGYRRNQKTRSGAGASFQPALPLGPVYGTSEPKNSTCTVLHGCSVYRNHMLRDMQRWGSSPNTNVCGSAAAPLPSNPPY
jgi:hypothetical protein